VRIPTFSRQSTTDTAETPERPAATGTVTRPRENNTTEVRTGPVRPRRDDEDTLTDLPPAPKAAERTELRPPPPRSSAETKPPAGTAVVDRTPAPTGPRPRATLLGTLGLIFGVASLLLVLSGPLLGYGIVVAGVALILSLSGIHATGKRHVAGKTDALLGMILALGAIVLGVLALTGSLNWLGTDVQPVNSLREWLDAHTVNRF